MDVAPPTIQKDRPIAALSSKTLAVSTFWPRWWWVCIPVFALFAYLPVVNIGFLGDDFVLLADAYDHRLDIQALFFQPGRWFYRPLGHLLVWRLGAVTWGLNPWPYHLISLLLHAGVALVLALWLAELTRRRALGWLAGALFAVFPLHLEAVAWVSAQWDTWAVFFVLISVWLFTRWWRRGGGWWYALALLFYTLGLFSKDSLLAFVPLFGLTAWAAAPPQARAAWWRLGGALLPFVGVLLLNLGLRYAFWGNIGGYPGTRADYANFFWDALTGFARVLLAPLNAEVLGPAAVQITAALTSLLLLCGLICYGRAHWRLLVLAAGWIVISLVPVLNLPINLANLQQNRLLYLAAVGYCAGVGALLYQAVLSNRWRLPARVVVGLLLGVSAATCWIHLAPWHTATAQAIALDQELRRLAPPQTHKNELVWYTEDVPVMYRGAFVYILGLNMTRYITDKEYAIPKSAPAVDAPLGDGPRDAFAFRFRFNPATVRYEVDYAAGVTAGDQPPDAPAQAGGYQLWDLRECAGAAARQWTLQGARAECVSGTGLTLQSVSPEASLTSPTLRIAPDAGTARFVRIRIALRYPAAESPLAGRWFWQGLETNWSEPHSRAVSIKQNGEMHIYWTFLSAEEIGPALTRLRFDLGPASGPILISWIALDQVP